MSDGRISPNNISELYEEPILWFIDRVGDQQLINYYNIISNNIISNNIISNIDYTLATTSLIRSKPSELILDEHIKFSEEQCECCICIDNKEAENICQFNCGHTFCVICIDTSLKTFRDRNQDVICSLCRANVKKITFKKQENRDKIQKYL